MANNPKNWNDQTPAAPTDFANVIFQAEDPDDDPTVRRNASAYMPIIEGDGIEIDIVTVGYQEFVQIKATGGGGGGSSSGFDTLLGMRRFTIVVADGANLIGAAPSYAIGDVWTLVKSDNLNGNNAMAAKGPFSSFAGNNFGDQAGIRGKYIYRTGKNIHALGMSWLLRTTNINFWFVLAESVGQEYGSQGFAQNGSPLTSVNFAAFRYSTTQGDSNFQCLTCDGSAITIADSGIAADTNAHKFLIVFDDTTPAVKFYIDGALVATNTTHLPSANKNLAIELSAAEPSSFAGEAISIIQIAAQSDF